MLKISIPINPTTKIYVETPPKITTSATVVLLYHMSYIVGWISDNGTEKSRPLFRSGHYLRQRSKEHRIIAGLLHGGRFSRIIGFGISRKIILQICTFFL